MPFRIRPTLTLALVLVPFGLKAQNLDGSSPEVGNAEAKRLYDYANDYISNVTEGDYSYAYMQFYWRRAESFLQRAARVYPDSPTGRALKADELKVGPYTVNDFRQSVLPRLAIKEQAAFDQVNCAIFLYERDTTRRDPARIAAFEDIIEVMSRQARWGEVLGFPAQGAMHTDLLRVMFREAARSRNDEHVIINQLLTRVAPGEQDRAQFAESQAEGMALLGISRPLLDDFLTKHPQDKVKVAALRGMVEREVQIRRRAALHIPTEDEIDTEHYVLLRLYNRDDIEAVIRKYWPDGSPPAAAKEQLAIYRAALGERPEVDAPLSAHLAYLGYLGAFEKYDQLEAYPDAASLTGDARRAAALKIIQIYSHAGRQAEADRWKAPFRAEGGLAADAAELADFRGRVDSTEAPFIVRPKTFAELPIKDPCVLSQAIMEWALAPFRSLRGMAPWDAVIYRYAPGFDKLPLPKSEEFLRAASATNPY